MTPLTHTNNLAARMGRWSATHRKTAIFGWLAFVVAALVLGGLGGTEKLNSTYSTVGESGQADEVLADRFDKPPTERLLIQHPRLTIDDRACRATINNVVRRLSVYDTVAQVRSPLEAENSGAVSTDRHSVLVEFQLRATETAQAQKDVEPILDGVESLQDAHPSFVL